MGRRERKVWEGGRGRYGEEGDEGVGRRERKVWGGGRGRYGEEGEEGVGRRKRKVLGGGRGGVGKRERKVLGGGRGRCGEEVEVHHLPADEYCAEGRVNIPGCFQTHLILSRRSLCFK